jgi:Na+(H+)/acetate symporter ActP
MNNHPANQPKILQSYLWTLGLIGYFAVGLAALTLVVRLLVTPQLRDNSNWAVCMLFIGILGVIASRILKLFDDRLCLLEQKVTAKQSAPNVQEDDTAPKT